MSSRGLVAPSLGAGLLLSVSAVLACCPAPPSGKPVVNADQTVVIVWDEAANTQHFIRQASFQSAADDFGFLVPSPTAPELEESGNDAFPLLRKLTEPETVKVPRPSGGVSCGCGTSSPAPIASSPTGRADLLSDTGDGERFSLRRSSRRKRRRRPLFSSVWNLSPDIP